jgi:hypothetical protein
VLKRVEPHDWRQLQHAGNPRTVRRGRKNGAGGTRTSAPSRKRGAGRKKPGAIRDLGPLGSIVHARVGRETGTRRRAIAGAPPTCERYRQHPAAGDAGGGVIFGNPKRGRLERRKRTGNGGAAADKASTECCSIRERRQEVHEGEGTARFCTNESASFHSAPVSARSTKARANHPDRVHWRKPLSTAQNGASKVGPSAPQRVYERRAKKRSGPRE